jgi:hypothetical protein
MALQIGTQDAQSGLTKEIFTVMDTLLSPAFQTAIDRAAGDGKTAAQSTLDQARTGWKAIAFAIATGVVQHLQANLEIRGVQVSGTVNAPVSGGVATQPGLTSAQTNSGPGLVR